MKDKYGEYFDELFDGRQMNVRGGISIEERKVSKE